MEKELPNIGTPEEAKTKMRQSYLAFIDIISKFVTISEFYTDEKNIGKPLGNDFASRYNYNSNKLRSSTPEDVYLSLGFFTLLELDFLNDVKENLEQYHNLLENEDNTLSDYDKACDYLSVKDEFTDEISVFDEVNRAIAYEKEAFTNYNDPDYDLTARQVEENKGNL